MFLPPLLTEQNFISSLNLFTTTIRTPRNFLFQRVSTIFTRNLLITMPMKTKIKKQCHLTAQELRIWSHLLEKFLTKKLIFCAVSCVSKCLCRLIFSGFYLLKISFKQFLRLTKKFIEICIFMYSISTCIFAYR